MKSVLRPADILPLGMIGVRNRPLRTVLSGLGIAIGIASVVAVLGISASSQAGLLRQIEALGTNLLTVKAGNNAFGDAATLPPAAPGMIARLPGVRTVAHVGRIPGAVYRNDHVPEISTGGISGTWSLRYTAPTTSRRSAPAGSRSWQPASRSRKPLARKSSADPG